jgi:hypothetical protein
MESNNEEPNPQNQENEFGRCGVCSHWRESRPTIFTDGGIQLITCERKGKTPLVSNNESCSEHEALPGVTITPGTPGIMFRNPPRERARKRA